MSDSETFSLHYMLKEMHDEIHKLYRISMRDNTTERTKSISYYCKFCQKEITP